MVTFIGVVIGTLAECQSFDHYWQVVPDPGANCRNGYAQLLTMGIADIITDVVLILFPLPIIIKSAMPVMRKISLCLLFSLSLFLLAIAAYRMPAIISVHGLQQRRTLWASIEILAAAAVSNSVVIGSFVRDRGVKKAKYRADELQRTGSADQPSINRVLTEQHWGNDSDQDLFRSLGGRLNSVADEGGLGARVPRAPQQVEPLPQGDMSKYSAADEKGAWGLKSQDLSVSDSSSDVKDTAPGTSQNFADNRHASQQMSFYDIGGILEDEGETMNYRQRGSVGARDFAFTNGANYSPFATRGETLVEILREEPPIEMMQNGATRTPRASRFEGTNGSESLLDSNGARDHLGPDQQTNEGDLQDIGGLLG